MELTNCNSTLSESLKGWYWRRRRYRRLHRGGEKPNQKPVKIVRLGTKGRIWRVRAVPKLRRLKIASSPLKLWAKFKSAYVDMMLNLAGNVGFLNNGSCGYGFCGNKRVSGVPPQIPKICSDDAEYKKRLVYEIYKVLVASKEVRVV